MNVNKKVMKRIVNGFEVRKQNPYRIPKEIQDKISISERVELAVKKGIVLSYDNNQKPVYAWKRTKTGAPAKVLQFINERDGERNAMRKQLEADEAVRALQAILPFTHVVSIIRIVR